jgi:ABC-type antimicrobial peptide transport system permease subunit
LGPKGGGLSFRLKAEATSRIQVDATSQIQAEAASWIQQGVVLAGAGVLIGVVSAAAGSRLLESLLFGVKGLDPIALGAACVIFVVVTLVASYIPARRASSVDPMIALRTE